MTETQRQEPDAAESPNLGAYNEPADGEGRSNLTRSGRPSRPSWTPRSVSTSSTSG
jgi:hypothetical protein